MSEQSIIMLALALLFGSAVFKGYNMGAGKMIAPIVSVITGCIFAKPLAAVLDGIFGNQLEAMCSNCLNSLGLSNATFGSIIPEELSSMSSAITGNLSARLTSSFSGLLLIMIAYGIVAIGTDFFISRCDFIKNLPYGETISRVIGGACGMVTTVAQLWLFYAVVLALYGIGFTNIGGFINVLNANTVFNTINQYNLILLLF